MNEELLLNIDFVLTIVIFAMGLLFRLTGKIGEKKEKNK